MKQLTNFLTIATLAALPLLANFSHASESNSGDKQAQKWYRVEVIIFAQRDAFGDEISPRDIVMSYPEKLIDLDNNRAGFTALPESENELGPDAYSLNRTGVYKVLYHQAWKQPGLAPENAPWITIDRRDDNTALGGSLRVYLSSYLHMENNIWRVSYATELESSQYAPLNAPSKQLDTANNIRNVDLVEGEGVARQATSTPPWPKPPAPPLHSTTPGISALNTAFSDTDTGDTALLASTISAQPNLMDKKSSTLTPAPRAIKDIILLKQESRLKLDKLHYFDHPKFGVLVKISRAKPVTIQPITIEPVESIERVEKPVVKDSLNEIPTIKESPVSP